MPPKQPTSDAAGHCAECATAEGVTEKRAPDATGNCPDGTVSATAAMPVITSVTMVVVTMGLSRRGDHYGNADR
jgi:hypothetical protein